MQKFQVGDTVEVVEAGGMDLLPTGAVGVVTSVAASPLRDGSYDICLDIDGRRWVLNARSWLNKLAAVQRRELSSPHPAPRLFDSFPSQVLDIITDKLKVLRVCYPAYRDDQLLAYMLLSTGIVDKLCSYNHRHQLAGNVVYEFTGARFCSAECMADWVAQQERDAQRMEAARG